MEKKIKFNNIVIDNNTYEYLKIKSLYITSNNKKNDHINWYKKDGEYYLFISSMIDINNVKIYFETEGINPIMSIYNNDDLVKDITSGDKLNLDYDKLTFKFETNVLNTSEYIINIMKSDIPALHINLDGDLDYIDDDINHETKLTGKSLIGNFDSNSTDDIKSFKGRGNASWLRPKKCYQIKYDKKVSMLGMDEAKTWILTANYLDGTLARNYIWYTLSNDIGIKYSVDVKTVDLYVNDIYMGDYIITNKVEVNSASVDILDSDYLLEIENHPKGNDYITTSLGNVITIHNPDLEDNENISEIKNSVLKLMNKMEKLIFDENTTTEELSNFIDYESFAKYYLVQEYSINLDAYRGSNYLYVKDNKIYMSPIWDMDATMNRSYYIGDTDSYYVLNNEALQLRINENFIRPLLKRKDFSRMVDKVFVENYKYFKNLVNKYEDYKKYIDKSAKMNYVRWVYSDMIKFQTLHTWIKNNHDYESACELFIKDLKDRLSFFEHEYKGLVFDKLIYEIDGVEFDLLDNNIKLTDDYFSKNIIIYGVLNDKKTKLDEFSLNEKEVTRSIVRTREIKNKYKKENRYVYDIKVSIGG